MSGAARAASPDDRFQPAPGGNRPTFEVDADRPVPAGIDGEAVVLDAPVIFRIRPQVLRVRIARQVRLGQAAAPQSR